MEKEVTIFSIKGEEKGNIALPSMIFSIKPNKDVLYDVMRMYLANRRQGTASTKERSEVRGGGRKPYKQKHTGRARAGSIRSPLRRGGGVVFGPKPRDYSFKVPKKMKRLAIQTAFTLKNEENRLKVIDNLNFDVPKTKMVHEMLKDFGVENKKTLLLLDKYSKNVFLSGRNIPNLKILLAKDANAYDILWAEELLLTKESIEIIKSLFQKRRKTKQQIFKADNNKNQTPNGVEKD